MKSFNTPASTNPKSILDKVITYFQPIIGFSKDTVSFEALARVQQGEEVSSIFPHLNDINRSGLRSDLEFKSLQDSCELIEKTLTNKQSNFNYVTVNLHGLTLADEKFSDNIELIFKFYPAAKDKIRFEIIEEPFPEDKMDIVYQNISYLFKNDFFIFQDDIGDNPELDSTRSNELKRLANGSQKLGAKFSKDFWKLPEEDRVQHLKSLEPSTEVVLEQVEDDWQMNFIHKMVSLFHTENSQHPLHLMAQGWHPDLGAAISQEEAVRKIHPSHERRLHPAEKHL